jgi:hypothetical protein
VRFAHLSRDRERRQTHEVTVECLLDQRPHLLRTGPLRRSVYKQPWAADRYHQHPLHETSPSPATQASSASTSEQVRFQRSLYLCSSHEKSSLLWSVVDSAASCSYCTEGIAFQASARATTRGDEAGACASVAAMIHLPADVPFVLHRPVHL